jgi:hypothetical protein
MARRSFPHLGKMKRIIRAVQATGEVLERIEAHGDDFIVVIAKRDQPPPPKIEAVAFEAGS